MLKANTGSSVLKSAKEAGLEAARKAAQGLSDIKLAFVYGSCDYNIHDMLAGVQEALPGVLSFVSAPLPELPDETRGSYHDRS